MNRKTMWTIVLIIVIAIAGVAWYYGTMNNAPAPKASGDNPNAGATSSNQTPSPRIVGAGEHCGGNMANAPLCGAGYHCAPDPKSHLPFGDVGGTCVADGKG